MQTAILLCREFEIFSDVHEIYYSCDRQILLSKSYSLLLTAPFDFNRADYSSQTSTNLHRRRNVSGHFFILIPLVSMALPAVIVSMITLTTSIAGILGVIKRRCGACQTISQLVCRSTVLVEKIGKLMKAFDDSPQRPNETRGISLILNLRHEEFKLAKKKLRKMKQRTERTNLIHLTNKFIMAQGWAKEIEAIQNELIHLRNGIENALMVWNSTRFASPNLQKMAANDLTTKKESGGRDHRVANDMNRKGAVNCNYQMRRNPSERLLPRKSERYDQSSDFDKLSVTAVWGKNREYKPTPHRRLQVILLGEYKNK